MTGTLIAKTPNGTGNIPELDLKATQAGRSGGPLSRSSERKQPKQPKQHQPSQQRVPAYVPGGLSSQGRTRG
ncbi:MAG: hypothetical protein QOF44_756 [Streptomyces sp.]|nr:hypothetical protein [Streptomyces sp.]